MKKLILLTLCTLLTSFAFGQLLTWDFAGNTGSEVSVAGISADAAVTGGTITRGTGINAANNANRFNANQYTQADEAAAIANNDYFQFTIDLMAGVPFCLTSIDFNFQRSGTGAANWSLRSSVDGFASNITTFTGLASGSANTITLPAASFASVTGTITFRFYGYGNTNNAGSAGFEGTGNDLVINGAAKPLPIELTSFEAKAKNKKAVSLKWTTASEKDNEYFSIEYSTDGRIFSEIGIVEGAGNSFVAADYQFTHNQAIEGSNYYRLLQVDFSGESSYSEVLVVELGSSQIMSIRPTFAKEDIYIVTEKELASQALVEVFNLSGQKVLHTVFPANSAQIELNVNALEHGHYFIKLTTDQSSESARFIKL